MIAPSFNVLQRMIIVNRKHKTSVKLKGKIHQFDGDNGLDDQAPMRKEADFCLNEQDTRRILRKLCPDPMCRCHEWHLQCFVDGAELHYGYVRGCLMFAWKLGVKL